LIYFGTHLITGTRQLPINRRQTVYPNGTLIVQNVVRDEDEGEYKCLIRDIDGRTAERSAHIRVLGKFGNGFGN